MLEAAGEVLPAAVGVALSPFPVIAVVLVLGSSRASANGIAFALGWVASLSALTAILIVVTGGTDDPTSDASSLVSWLRVAIGVALLVVAAEKWRSRPRDGAEPQTPGWMASLDGIGPPRAFVVGAALAGANPKNLAFTLAAASSIAALGLVGTDAAAAGAVYVALGSSSVVGAVSTHLVAGSRSEPALASIKQFMLVNNAVIMMVILLVLGAKLLGDGLAGI